MVEMKQVCVHFLSGNCKYGNACTRIHVSPTSDILKEIEKKGPVICNFYPKCKFNSNDCRKLHIDTENQYEKDFNEFKKFYLNIINYETSNQFKLNQIERIKSLVKNDLDIIKDTWSCISEY